MDLDHRRADRDRRLDLGGLGGDEQRDPDAGLVELGDRGRELRALPGGIEAAFGGALLAPLGHEAGGVRPGLQRDRHHLVGRRHLEIERLCDLGLQPRHVVVADVAAVLAQMRGDAVGAGLDRELGRAHRIGMPPAARVADGRDVVDIDAEAKMRDRGQLIAPSVRATDGLHASTRSALATTSLARNCAMIELRCLRS